MKTIWTVVRAGVAMLATALALIGQQREAPRTFDIAKSAALWQEAPGELRGGGGDYRVRFDQSGLRFEPALGRAVPTVQHLQLQPLSVRRGGESILELPTQAMPVIDSDAERRVRYRHAAGIAEHFEVNPAEVALSWHFASRPVGEGDLVVRYDVDSSLPAPRRVDGGLRFAGAHGGIHIGAVTGIDADGSRVPGELRFVDGVLELSLPGEFVDAASYPMVLDPAVTSVLIVANFAGGAADGVDLAYAAAADEFFVVYGRSYSSVTGEMRGQYVGPDGTLSGSWILLSGGNVDGPPAVAYHATLERFGVTFRDRDPVTQARRIRYFAVTGAAVTHSLVADYGGNYFPPDIGCDTNGPVGSQRGFVIAYHDVATASIRARRVYFSSTDQLISPVATTVFSNGGLLGPFYSDVAISSGADSSDDLLVAVRRESGIGPTFGVRVRTIDCATGALGTVRTIFSTQTGDATKPHVDGFGGRWIVGWNDWTTSNSLIATRTVRRDPGSSSLVLGPVVYPLGNTPRSNPRLGYTPGRTWLAHRGLNEVKFEAIDSGSCVTCNDSLTWQTYSPGYAVGTSTASGASEREWAMVAWTVSSQVLGVIMRNYGSGQVVSLGGGCGVGGMQTLSHEAGIGSAGLVSRVDGLPAAALATVFNFSPTVPPIVCGSCEWLPFLVTLMPPISAGASEVEFPIPCLTSLVGTQFETQWTTLDLTQPGCIVPGVALSDRWSLTIGN